MKERTTEEQREYEKQRMLHFAAQLDQIRHELHEFAKNEHKGSMYANHQMGVALSNLGWASRELIKQAGR